MLLDLREDLLREVDDTAHEVLLHVGASDGVVLAHYRVKVNYFW